MIESAQRRGQRAAGAIVADSVFCAVALCLFALASRQGAAGAALLVGGACCAAWARTRFTKPYPSQSAHMTGETRDPGGRAEDIAPLSFSVDGSSAGSEQGRGQDADVFSRAERDTLLLRLDAQDAELAAQSALFAERDAQLAQALEQAARAREQESGWQALALAAQSAHAKGESERELLTGHIGGMADALAGQVVTCLAEAELAISSAIESFTRIAGEAQEAAAQAQKAVGADAENSVSRIATRTAEVMGMSIIGMLASARRIAASAQKLERLSDVSQRLCGLLDEVENAADRTGLIALNASIEAARAGNAGRTFAVVAREVSKLAQMSRGMAERMRGLTGELSRETRAVHTDLALTAESSLEEACGAQAEVNRLMESLCQADAATQEVLHSLGERSRNITNSYTSIVMAFQFHDLLRQRLEHVAQPLAELSSRLQDGAVARDDADVLAYAVGQNAFQARAVGAAPTLEVVTYAPAEDSSITLF